MPNKIRPEPSERPKSAGVLALLEKRQLTGSEWSFIFLAKSAGPQAAKDAVLTAITTVGVINALMLSFVVPSLSSFPATLAAEMDDPDLVTRLWFWFSFLSVVSSIISLILATLILTYMTPVPPRGVVDYLIFIHLPFSLCAFSFICSVLLQGAAQLSVIHSYISKKDFWVAVGILLASYIGLICYFIMVDQWSQKNNTRFYHMWLEERGDGKGGKDQVQKRPDDEQEEQGE